MAKSGSNRGAIGIDVGSNQVKMIELDPHSNVLQTEVIEVNTEIFPQEEVNQLLSNAQQEDAQIALVLPLQSSITACTWVPKSFEDPNLFIQDEISRLLPAGEDEYFIAIDTQGPKSVDKGTLSIAVAVRHEELDQVKQSLSNVVPAPQILETPVVTTLNLLDKFNLDLPESYVTIHLENDRINFLLFKDGKFTYSETQIVNSEVELDSTSQEFLERYFADNSQDVKLFVFGSGLVQYADYGASLPNEVKHLSLDSISDGVWDNSTKYSCALAFSIASSSMES